MKRMMLIFSAEKFPENIELIKHMLNVFSKFNIQVVVMLTYTIYAREIQGELINEIKKSCHSVEIFKENINDDYNLEYEISIPNYGKGSLGNVNSYIKTGYTGKSIQSVIEYKNSIYIVPIIKSLIDKYNIDIVLSTTRYDRLIYIIKALNIPVATYVGGKISIDDKKSSLFDDSYMAKDLFYISDLVFSWGKNMNYRMHKSGYTKKNLLLIGSPQNDVIYNKINNVNSSIKNNIRNTYNFSEKKVICYIWTGFICFTGMENKNYYIKKFFDFIKFFKKNMSKEYVLLLKMHPNDFREEYKELLETVYSFQDKTIKVIDKKFKFMDVAIESDLIIGSGSTADAESALFDKPYIFYDINLETVNEYSNIAGYKISKLNKKTYKNIENILKKDPYRINRKLYIENEFFRFDGKVCERIAEEIIKILS